MKHYYTIETREGAIVADALTKKDAIRTARKSALDYKESMTIHKVDKETRRTLDYVGIAEFPYFLRNCQLDLRDITFVAI